MMNASNFMVKPNLRILLNCHSKKLYSGINVE